MNAKSFLTNVWCYCMKKACLMYGSMMMVQREKENLGLGSKFMIKEFMDVKEG